jgi:hypothetical protein
METELPTGRPRPAANHGNVLRAPERRKLERRARRLEADREALRDAMREAKASGATLREIAEVVGMSHAGVAKWLRQED